MPSRQHIPFFRQYIATFHDSGRIFQTVDLLRVTYLCPFAQEILTVPGHFFKRVLPGCHSRGRSRGCVEIAIEDSTNMRRSTFSALGPLNKTDLAWDRRYTKGEVRGSDAEQVGDGQNSTQNGTRADNRTQETFSLRLPCYNHCCHKAMAHHSCN